MDKLDDLINNVSSDPDAGRSAINAFVGVATMMDEVRHDPDALQELSTLLKDRAQDMGKAIFANTEMRQRAVNPPDEVPNPVSAGG